MRLKCVYRNIGRRALIVIIFFLRLQSNVVYICVARDASHTVLFGHRQRPDRFTFGRGQQGNGLGDDELPGLR